MDMNVLPTNGNLLANQAAGPGALPIFKTEEYNGEEGNERDELRRTDRLTEAEKEKIVFECKDALSKEEAERIIDQKVPYGEMGNFLDEVRDSIL